METVNDESVCVCAANYYQTSDTNDPPVCEACPTGSTTEGITNSIDFAACGKYSKTLTVILKYVYFQRILALIIY